MQQTICDYRISLEETLVLKGFAILAMVFHHLFLDTSVYGEWLFLLNPFIAGLAIVCKVCLPIFLFLSGYGFYSQLFYNSRFHYKSFKLVIAGNLKSILKSSRQSKAIAIFSNILK